MENLQRPSYPAGTVPEASIVELPDGRIGYVGRSLSKKRVLVVLQDGGGVEVKPGTNLVLIKASFTLARDYIEDTFRDVHFTQLPG